jgi:glutamyl-tRNA reductase
VSRSAERAAALALSVGAHPVGVPELATALHTADVVFGCTSAPHPVITLASLSERTALRPGAPLICVDLGIPRDVDPMVATLPGLSMVTLTDLSKLADDHREARRAELPAADAIVAAETRRFLAWLAARDVFATARAPAMTAHG